MSDSAMTPAGQVRSYRQLMVWQRSIDLAVEIHRASLDLPPFERFELGRQMRRSAVSVPSNVAEGCNRHSQPAYRSHIAIALGSNGELDTQLEIAKRLGYFAGPVLDRFSDASDEVGRLLQGLWRSLGREK